MKLLLGNGQMPHTHTHTHSGSVCAGLCVRVCSRGQGRPPPLAGIRGGLEYLPPTLQRLLKRAAKSSS